MSHRKSGFTVVEYFIVAIIFCLLAAMAIPAYLKIKCDTIEEAVMAGRTLSTSDQNFWNAHKSMVSQISRDRVDGRLNPVKYQQVMFDGKLYNLVPAN